MMKQVGSILFIVFISLAATCQIKQTDCKELLKQYASSLKNINTPKGKEIYYMEMRMKAEMRKGSAQPDIDEQLTVYASEDKYICEGKNISTYIDKKNAFSVLHAQKMIYWIPVNGNEIPKEGKATDQYYLIQDSLIRVSEVSECSIKKEGEKSYRYISILPPFSTYSFFGITRAEYFYDEHKKDIAKVVLYYTKENQVNKTTIFYDQIDYNYKKKSVLTEAFYKVFNSNKKLVPRYSHYQVVSQKE